MFRASRVRATLVRTRKPGSRIAQSDRTQIALQCNLTARNLDRANARRAPRGFPNEAFLTGETRQQMTADECAVKRH